MLESQLPYRVIVHNDEEHSYDYVIEAFVQELGMPRRGALELAKEIDDTGRVAIPVADLPAAQALQERLFSHGADRRIPASRGSLAISIEERTGPATAARVVNCGRVTAAHGFERLDPATVGRARTTCRPAAGAAAAAAAIAERPRMLRCGRLPCHDAEMTAPPAWFLALFGFIAIAIFAGSMVALAFSAHR